MAPALGILFIAETWLIGFCVLSIPFWLYGFTPVDAFFETVSGFTTTGASIVADIEALPSGIILWRAMIQWAGGITVVLIFTFLLPALGVGSSGFVSNEFVGSESDTYASRITSRAFRFFETYALLTGVEIVLLTALGTGLFNAVCISFSTIPTGGQLPLNDSMASFSVYIQAVTLVFMVLGATNFYLMFRALFHKDRKSLVHSQELRNMLVWFALCTVIITGLLLYQGGYGLADLTSPAARSYLWQSAYCVVSAGSTTGFVIVDYKSWPLLALMFLIVLELAGGMSGSTSGGIKMHRLIVLRSYIAGGFRRMIHPNAVTTVRLNGQALSDDAVNSAISTIMLFILTSVCAVAVLTFLEPGLDLISYVGLAVSSITNTGISVGTYSSMDSMAVLGSSTKLFMCLLMWLGRMELVMAMMMFTKNFWTDVRLSLGSQHNLSARRPLSRPPQRRQQPWSYLHWPPMRKEQKVVLFGTAAHRQDPEDRRVAGLNLIDRAHCHLGLPVIALVRKAVAYGLQRPEVLVAELQGL